MKPLNENWIKQIKKSNEGICDFFQREVKPGWIELALIPRENHRSFGRVSCFLATHLTDSLVFPGYNKLEEIPEWVLHPPMGEPEFSLDEIEQDTVMIDGAKP